MCGKYGINVVLSYPQAKIEQNFLNGNRQHCTCRRYQTTATWSVPTCRWSAYCAWNQAQSVRHELIRQSKIYCKLWWRQIQYLWCNKHQSRYITRLTTTRWRTVENYIGVDCKKCEHQNYITQQTTSWFSHQQQTAANRKIINAYGLKTVLTLWDTTMRQQDFQPNQLGWQQSKTIIMHHGWVWLFVGGKISSWIRGDLEKKW